jgi:hypothetical protein
MDPEKNPNSKGDDDDDSPSTLSGPAPDEKTVVNPLFKGQKK